MADLYFTYCNECGDQEDCLYDPPNGFICLFCRDALQEEDSDKPCLKCGMLTKHPCPGNEQTCPNCTSLDYAPKPCPFGCIYATTHDGREVLFGDCRMPESGQCRERKCGA